MTHIPTGCMPCPDPDCEEFPETCFGKPEDFTEVENLTEPDECEKCGSTDGMTWDQADKGWYCDCGQVHLRPAAIKGLGPDGKF